MPGLAGFITSTPESDFSVRTVVDQEADKIFDDAFQREYKKLP
jgi:hypothetical protein